MPSVIEAQAALDSAVSKKNATDSTLVDLLAKEQDLSAQLGRLLADSAPTEDVLAIRKDRDQARQDVEDLESALGILDDPCQFNDYAARRLGEVLSDFAESYDGRYGLHGRAAQRAYIDRTAYWTSRF